MDRAEELPGSVAAAQAAVEFEVSAPANLGDPVAIYVSSEEIAPELRVVAFIYDSPYGRVDVLENLPQVDPADYNQSQADYVASHKDNPNLVGSVEIVQIRESLQGLMTVSGDASWSALFWLENGVEMTVWGPTLVSEDSLAIANSIW